MSRPQRRMFQTYGELDERLVVPLEAVEIDEEDKFCLWTLVWH